MPRHRTRRCRVDSRMREASVRQLVRWQDLAMEAWLRARTDEERRQAREALDELAGRLLEQARRRLGVQK